MSSANLLPSERVYQAYDESLDALHSILGASYQEAFAQLRKIQNHLFELVIADIFPALPPLQGTSDEIFHVRTCLYTLHTLAYHTEVITASQAEMADYCRRIIRTWATAQVTEQS